ncbi:preprotein translocase subunit SecG [Dongia deserti]|uniref:preprotein translocase subunit SecG n=1 Tax=Dongia deserti TaxID=2268030 RepID=UPI000E65B772|nr:preprotein translocase subunit SecG [Dongia deserti]
MQIILVIHVLIAMGLVGAILLQKKEGGIGGLGGGGGGGLGGLMSGRAKADTLSKATGVLATAFFVTSLALAIIGSRSTDHGPLVPGTTGTAPVTAPVEQSAPAGEAAPGGTAPAETAPVQPATPAVPTGD